MLDLLQATARPGCVSEQKLRGAILEHIRAFKAAHGPDPLTAKAHYALAHIWQYLRKYGFIPNTLVHERKHKIAKKYADHLDNTSAGYDQSVFEECVSHSIHRLTESPSLLLDPALINPGRPTKAVLKFLREAFGNNCAFSTSNVCRFARRGACAVGDVVLFKIDGSWAAGRVWVHASVDGVLLTGANMWELQRWEKELSMWKAGDRAMLLESTLIREVCVWTEDAGTVTILHPVTVV